MTTTKQKLGPWTDAENRVIADEYVTMLAAELAGEKYVKAAHRRLGLAAMAKTRDDKAQRSAGSWEMKCCNISAVLHAAGMRYINGYKPLGHGQQKALARALADAMRRQSERVGAAVCQWQASADKLCAP